MALNFPANPTSGDVFTDGSTTWRYDGTAWNVEIGSSASNVFTRVNADVGSTIANTINDTLTLSGGSGVQTSIVGDTLTIDATAGNIIGGTNISTVTDGNNVTINLDSLSINFLNDVDTDTVTPSTGSVLKWDGAKWAPGIDATSGGSGLDADTLDGFNGDYYLNYNNFTNSPNTFVTLLVSGQSNIIADSNNDALTFVAGSGISLTTDPASDSLTVGLSTPIPTELTDLGISDGSAGQVLTTDGSGSFTFTTVEGGGGSSQNLFETVQADSGSTTANTATDTLTISGGTDISTAISGDTITITYTGSAGGVTTFSALTEANSADLDINDVYEHAIVTLRVDNSGASAYTFNSHYTGNNPTLVVLSGTTVAFDLDAIGGHPFELQDGTLTPITSGLVHVASDGTVSTNSNAQGQDSGTLYWRIDESISGTYAYQCQIHAAMVGAITVKRLSTL